MKKLFFYFLMSAVLFSCVQGSKPNGDNSDPLKTMHDSLLKVIATNERSINDAMGSAALDMNLASSTVNAYQMFVKKFPNDTNVAMYLYKASAIYTGAMKQYQAGAECLEIIIRDHQDFKKLPMCYFQLGAIYDDNLNDDAKAKIYYDEFLKKYPDSKLAPQVKSLIALLGKTNEEVIKEFEKKNPEKNGAGKK